MDNNIQPMIDQNSEQLLKDSIFKVGKVTSIEDRSVKVKVDKTKNTSYLLYKGDLLKNISVGGYVKIIKGFIRIIGKIDGEYIKENIHTNKTEHNFDYKAEAKKSNINKKDYGSEKEKIDRILNISLLGFFGDKGFEKGIKELPLIDNDCFLLEKQEFNDVHNFKKGEPSINIGSLSLEKGQPIEVSINRLFASHIGIFGNTGSGKSYTLAKIYGELFKQYSCSKFSNFKKDASFLLFDFNGEYVKDLCLTKEKTVYNLTTKENKKDIKNNEKFPLSEDDLIDIELISILANATEKTQKPFISRALNFYKKVHDDPEDLNFFKNILKKRVKEVLRMADKDKARTLIDYLAHILETQQNQDLKEELFSKIEWNNTNHHFMPKKKCRELTTQEIQKTPLYTAVDEYEFPPDFLSKIIHFLYQQLIFDVYTDKAHNDHIAPAINKLKSKQKDIAKVLNTNPTQNNIFDQNNLIILNLKNVNLEMKKTLPLLIAKKIYKEHKNKQDTNEHLFLNIIIDEAHNILSKESFREAESWKDYRLETFEEIIKEGRKFGVFLTIASQRPHDISLTIISQLHNYFLHRLTNNHDITAIERTISYLNKLAVEYFSIMPIGTCILTGLMTQVPVIVNIGKIEPKDSEPNNKTIQPAEHWAKQKNIG